MPPATSSVVATASAMSSSSDISLPSSPSPSPEPSPDPYAFSSDDEADADAAPVAKKRKPRNLGGTAGVPRTWPAADEVVLLEAVAARKEQHGRLPKPADVAAALAGRLPYTAEQVANRVHALRARYRQSVRQLRRGTVPVTDDDVRVFRLSKRIWEGVPKPQRRPRAAPHHERREFAELEGAYPCLASVVEAVDAKYGASGMMKLAFGRIGDEQAAELEAKVKRQRLAQMKADARRALLVNLVARTLLGAME